MELEFETSPTIPNFKKKKKEKKNPTTPYLLGLKVPFDPKTIGITPKKMMPENTDHKHEWNDVQPYLTVNFPNFENDI